MRPSRRRVTAVALLVFGLALVPLSARPAHHPRHGSPAVSPAVAIWNELLSLLGLKAADESDGTSAVAQPEGIATTSSTAAVPDDGRAGLDPNG